MKCLLCGNPISLNEPVVEAYIKASMPSGHMGIITRLLSIDMGDMVMVHKKCMEDARNGM